MSSKIFEFIARVSLGFTKSIIYFMLKIVAVIYNLFVKIVKFLSSVFKSSLKIIVIALVVLSFIKFFLL